MARGDSALSRVPLLAKFGIGAGLVFLVAIAYFVVFWGDTSSSIKAAQGQERQLREQLAEARKTEFAYQKDVQELTDRQQRQRELEKILPASSEAPAFLSSLQSVANVTGVSLSAWTPQQELPESFYARVPMKLELSGRFHQIAKFFYGVGQLDRIINMENIAITDPKQQGEDLMVKVEALATAFRTLPEGAAGEKKGDKRPASTGKQAPKPGTK